MIAAIKGTVESLQDRETMLEAVVDTGGICYRIFVPTRDLEELSGNDRRVTLHTHLHVREDAMILYGFTDPRDRDAFEILIQAPGVGPRLAMAALSVYSSAELVRAVDGGDASALAAVPGIGPKLARRIVAELRDKLGAASGALQTTGALAEARAALAELGYKAAEITEALRGADPSIGTDGLVRHALKALSQAKRAV